MTKRLLTLISEFSNIMECLSPISPSNIPLELLTTTDLTRNPEEQNFFALHQSGTNQEHLWTVEEIMMTKI